MWRMLVLLVVALHTTMGMDPLDKACPVDVCFVLDDSGSMYGSVELQRDFVLNFVDATSLPDTRVGVVKFASYPTLLIDLDDHTAATQNDDLHDEVVDLPLFASGGTNIGPAIAMARTECFNQIGDRPSIPNIMVLITDGFTSNIQNAIEEAQLSRDDGIEVIVIGAGGFSANQLELISASVPHPNGTDLFFADDFNELLTLQDVIFTRICFGSPVCCMANLEGIKLWHFNGTNTPDPKSGLIKLFEWNPHGNGCKFQLWWFHGNNPKAKPQHYFQFKVGNDPGEDGFFREILMNHDDEVGDQPSQKGWHCNNPKDPKLACPNGPPGISPYPYSITDAANPGSTVFAEVQKKDNVNHIYMVQQGDTYSCEDDEPSYLLTYNFDAAFDEAEMSLCVSRDWYETHYNLHDISGYCIDGWTPNENIWKD